VLASALVECNRQLRNKECAMFNTSIRHHPLAAVVAGAFFTAALFCQPIRVEAATVAVTNCNDSGPGSLRNAAARAQSGDLLDLRRLRCTIVLTRGAIEITQQDLALVGRGTGALFITSQNRSRILSHEGTGTLRIAWLSIVDGRLEAETSATGGCIYSAGNVSLQHARVHQCDVYGYPAPDCEGTGTCSSSWGGAISARGNVRMAYSTVSDGSASNYDSVGGGIYAAELIMFRSRLLRNSSEGSGGAQVRRFIALGSIIADNQAGDGYPGPGGVDVVSVYSVPGTGAADVRDTTFAGNTTGGGLCSALCADDARIVNSTFTRNAGRYAVLLTDGSIVNSTVADNSSCGGGVRAITLYLESAILAGNSCGTGGMDLTVTGSLTGTHNLVGVASIPLPPGTLRGDPLLAPLAFNGGYTPTRALRAGSPAIDRGSNPLGLEYDQRGPGFPRVSGSRADIGAFERHTGD
jgi:hypothetical protein